ncbi:MAG: polysaccharide biosynthesis C-terminal domain-containing protein [Clostridia bacterium]|nr:polysaccharide biosynthesis C-terminal domain-containing protein [Clostridia bacterium]
MKSRIQLSDHFTYKRLIRFVLPTVFMMIFTSVYGVVDGIFVANFVGQVAFQAVNLVMPFLMVLGAVGFMIGAGGSAIVSKTLGEGDNERANKYFSFLTYFTLGSGVILAILGELLAEVVCVMLGATGDNAFLLEPCVRYLRVVLIGIPFFMLQNIFQTFFSVAEKPKLGFLIVAVAGVMNMILDFFFVYVFKWGIEGAAGATITSEIIGGTVPFVYFLRKNPTVLRLISTRFFGRVLIKTCGNGLSEFANNVSGSFVSMLYNVQLLKYVGASGVSAYGTLMYVNFIFFAIFIGYAIGSAQIVGFNFGAQNREELKNVFKKSCVIMGVLGVMMCITAEISAPLLAYVFAGGDAQVYSLTCRAFLFSGFIFILVGFNVFGSAFFTALSNGIVSFIVSILRTLAFQSTAVLLLPPLFEAMGLDPLDGIWCSGLVSNVLTFAVTMIFFTTNKKKYGYA